MLYLLIVILVVVLVLGAKMAADFTALNGAVAKLQTDVNALIAAGQPSVQPQIDAATAAVTAVDATVVAATPAPAA